MTNDLQVNEPKLASIAKNYTLRCLALFGSYARNEAKQGSDVDIYVRFGRDVELFEVLALKHELEDALELEVDLVVEEAVILHPFVRDGMMKDLRVLYEDAQEKHAIAK